MSGGNKTWLSQALSPHDTHPTPARQTRITVEKRLTSLWSSIYRCKLWFGLCKTNHGLWPSWTHPVWSLRLVARDSATDYFAVLWSVQLDTWMPLSDGFAGKASHIVQSQIGEHFWQYQYQSPKYQYQNHLQGPLFGNTKVSFQLPELQASLVDLNLSKVWLFIWT